MPKNSPKNNLLSKGYYGLDEVAESFGISELDLIHFGVAKDLPICVLARDWQVELHSRRLNFPDGRILSTFSPALAAERDAAFQDDSKVFGHAVLPNKLEYSARHPSLKVLNGPIRVAARTLQIYEIEGSSADAVVELIAEGQPLPGYEYRYRFSHVHLTGKAKLNEIKFVFREQDFPALELLLNDASGNENAKEPSASKRLETLQMQLAGVAWLASRLDKSLSHQSNPNAEQIAIAVSDLLATEELKVPLQLHGMSVSNIRINIGLGMKLLRANMP